MSSEKLASAKDQLKGDLGGSWNILEGSESNYTDLGIARRFGAAAAAYSLRDIGAMNGSVVRVRREPEDTTDAIDDEERFSANQVQSGALEDWVNGKLESTLPADVATAAAAYSLRKVKASYSGDAVRIRRTSDSVEVNVAFDSDDKVTASSSISTVSGETNATTVAEFLSEERTTFVTNPVFSVSGGGGSITQEVTNTSASFSFQGGTNNFIRDARKPANLGAETGDTISFDVTASGVSTDFSVRLRVVGANTEIISPTISDLNNGTRTVTLTVGSNAPAGYFAFTGLNTTSTGTVTIDNIKVVGKSATVHTWYDQAGANDAVQETAGNQPKIAEDGALLANSVGTPTVKFTGSNLSGASYTSGNSLRADGLASTFTGTDKTIFASNVSENVATDKNGVVYGFGNTSTDSARLFFLYQGGGLYGTQYQGTTGSDFEYVGTTVANQSQLFTNDKVSTSANIFNNSVTISSNYTVNVGNINLNTFAIGAVQRTSESVYLDGNVSELILYTSDQSNNRFKIESNINNYYGLYNDANDMAEAFRATSGTLTNESKDGFDLAVGTPTAYVGFEFNEKIANGDSVFISFNLDLTGGSGGDATPIIRLTKTTLDGADSSNFINPSDLSQGFNSFELTSNDNDAKFFSISEGNDNVNISISDFKVSRIARNGLVETLYDQSGNGRDMAQTTAGDQPHIVENGGICKDSTNNPTVKYVNVGTNLGSTFLSTTAGAISSGETSLCYLTVASISTNVPTRQTFNGAGTDFCLGGTNLRLRYNGSADTFTTSSLAMSVNTNHLVVASVNSSKICTLHLDDNSETDTSPFTANASTLNQLLGENSSSSTSDNLGLQGTMSEMILYLGDKTNDISDLQNDINNFYNI